MSASLPEAARAGAQSLRFTQMIDLSTGIAHEAVHEPWPPSIRLAKVKGPIP